jgi:hypothetical protein
MTWHSYYIGETISKTTEPLRLWETEKGIIEMGTNAIAIPVMLNGSLEGYVFHGRGNLVLDTVMGQNRGLLADLLKKK